MSQIPGNLGASSPQRSLRTMVVDDESLLRGPLGLCLETLGHHVVEAATVDEAIGFASRAPIDVALVDLRLGTTSGLDLMARLLALQPRLKIIIITAYGSVDVAVRAMARGATDFLCKPFTPQQVAVAVAHAASLRDLESEVGIMPDRHGTAGPEADFATTNGDFQKAILALRRAAPLEVPILIGGESGTGKSVLARAVHGWGRQPEGPFMTIDCSARSAAFVDLALFGDAVAGEQIITADEQPLLLKASGGTLLIKRVDALSTRSQERLAQVMETRIFEATSWGAAQACDCRIIATIVVPENAVPQGALWTQLGGIRLWLPPLRNRADDIPMLAQRYLSFARQNEEKQALGFAVDAIDRMMGYEWPGNLRELHQEVDDAFKVADAPYIEIRHLSPQVRKSQSRRRPRAGDAISLRDLEMAHIREVVASSRSLQESADMLGIDLQALYRRRKQYGIE